MSLRDAQVRLLTVWLAFAAVAFVSTILQTGPRGVYFEIGDQVWDWFVPTLSPTLGLLVGSMVRAGADESARGVTVSTLNYRLALWLSIAYLVSILVVLFEYRESSSAIAGIKGASRFLSALYGLVSVALGALFVSKPGGSATPPTPRATEP